VLQEFGFFLDYEKALIEGELDGPTMSWHSARLKVDGKDE
jgi:hypothetical protein